MNTQKVQEALARRFSAPMPPHQKRRVVFWYDEDAGFNDIELQTLVPEGVRLLKLEQNTFLIRKTIEHDEPTESFLVYSAARRPADSEHWLLDIELFGETFAADQASNVIDELGLNDLSLRPVIQRHAKFFASSQRIAAFRSLGLSKPTELDVERGIVAILAGVKSTTPEVIVRAVLLAGLDGESNKALAEFSKQGVGETFWAIVEDHCGFKRATPGLRPLFHSLVLTATAEELHLTQKETSGWDAHLLPPSLRSRAVVFVDHWLSHVDHARLYDEFSAQAWRELELDRQADRWNMDAVAGGRTFEKFDQMVMNEIVRGLLAEELALDRYQGWIAERRRGHWWRKYENAYRALEAAIGLLRLRAEWEGRFAEDTPKAMAAAYAAEYHRFDRFYRDFTTARRAMDADLGALAERVEDLYANWFLPKLMDRWMGLVAESMAAIWSLPDVLSQREFFQKRVLSTAGDRNKVFVIISDGLRYEVAAQLCEELQQETRSEPKLEWMLGTVPSITELCMAALLPHQHLTWTREDGVLADGMSTDGSGNREKILRRAFDSSLVVSYRDIMEWSKDVGREKTVGPRVIFIYHNAIDMDGDKVGTEEKTFEAAAKAVGDLKRLIAKIANQLNGINVLVTADHGFLFQQSPLPESDKLAVEKLEPIHAGRRDVVGRKAQALAGTVEIRLDPVLGKDCGLSAYVPRGNTRFSSGGGSRYVHGGASLQEVVVPLLVYNHVRSGYKDAEAPKKVEVELATTDRRITSTPFPLSFHQVEPVGGKVLPRRLRIALWTTGGDERKASSEELIVADVSTNRPEDRRLTIRLHLNSGTGNGDYVLRAFDEESGVEYSRTDFRVSLAINQIDFFR